MVDNSQEPLKSIVVVGAGLVAAGAAVTLARFLDSGSTQVIWVQPSSAHESTADVAVVDPALRLWLEMVGCDEAALIRACKGLYSYGTHYQAQDKQFFVPYGTHGIPPSPAPFEHEFFRRFQGEHQLAFAEHFLATQAANNGRFDFPVDDPRSAKSTLSYGLHLEQQALLNKLSAHARSLGVKCLDGESLRVQGSPEHGIDYLVLSDGTRVDGDFFIDASGAGADLMGQVLNVELEPARAPLWPFRVTYSEPPERPWQPRARLSREPWGWCRRTGLQDQVVVDCWVRDQSSLQSLERTLAEEGYSWRSQAVLGGGRSQGWVHNCLAIGGADAHPGELSLSEWFWASRCLLLWLDLVPNSGEQPHLRNEYNRRRQSLYEILSEVHWMHAAGEKQIASEWPDALRWRLSVFQAFGRLSRRDDEVLSDESWIALALGLGWHPRGHDITLADTDRNQLAQKHQAITRVLAKAVDAMPTLEAIIKRSEQSGRNKEVKQQP